MEYQKSKRSNKKLYKRSDKRTKKRLNRRPDKRTKKKYKRVGGTAAIANIVDTSKETPLTIEKIKMNESLDQQDEEYNSDKPIYIIRHGLSCANAKMYKSKVMGVSTHYKSAHKILDPSLTKSSIEKSTGQTSSDLHEAIKKIIFDKVNPDRKFILCCSTLFRTQETCYHMFKRYLDHENCLNKSIYILPYCNEKNIDKDDNKPNPEIWGITSEDQKITKIQERVFKNYETLFKTKEPRKKFEVAGDSIGLVDRKIFNLDYIEGVNVSETSPDSEKFIEKLKDIKKEYPSEDPIIVVVTHSDFMKDELKVPEKPKNNSIYNFTMKIHNPLNLVNEFNYKGKNFDGFDNSEEDLDQEDEICETNSINLKL
tara:strand:+ start:4286 stop:5392 length:1107 start_codon:yes stop_codon:yes gene_type:complete